jgi:L-fucose dehydrogenase
MSFLKVNAMDLGLKDKKILVSGGAKGIGAGIVRILAQEGAIPIIVGRNEADNANMLASIENKGFAITADLIHPEACAHAVHSAIQWAGCLDGLVNNAGINDGVGLEKGNYSDFLASLHRNLIHYYLLAQYTLPYLKKTKGAIVNITSKTAETGQGNTSAYAAANGGRNALTREWAVELLPYHIRVNAVVVSESWTPLYEKWLDTLSEPEKMLDKIKKRIPLGNRMTTCEEIGQMVAFLLSEQSSHTTGQLIHVDGGYVHLDRAID